MSAAFEGVRLETATGKRQTFKGQLDPHADVSRGFPAFSSFQTAQCAWLLSAGKGREGEREAVDFDNCNGSWASEAGLVTLLKRHKLVVSVSLADDCFTIFPLRNSVTTTSVARRKMNHFFLSNS